MSICLLSHESTERNDGRNTREEQEDNRRKTLQVQSVPEHAEVHYWMITVLDVVDHTSEKSASRHNKNLSYRKEICVSDMKLH